VSCGSESSCGREEVEDGLVWVLFGWSVGRFEMRRRAVDLSRDRFIKGVMKEQNS
jgi:hypothetical protein